MENFKDELAKQFAFALYPLSSLIAYIAGITLVQWAAVSSIGYVLLQSAFLIWKWRREAKGK